MKITLTPTESEQLFHTALCNTYCLGTFNYYNLELYYGSDKYKAAKAKLDSPSNVSYTPCIEDIMMQILKDGGELRIIDQEDNEIVGSVTLQDIHNKMSDVPSQILLDMINENDDEMTADVLLQTLFFGEVVYG